MDKTDEALNDADKALEKEETNSRAITAKAEALFSSGQFEKALVQFEKGNKLRQESMITTGLKKCRQAIVNSIGEDGIVFEKELVEIAIREQKREQGMLLKKLKALKQMPYERSKAIRKGLKDQMGFTIQFLQG